MRVVPGACLSLVCSAWAWSRSVESRGSRADPRATITSQPLQLAYLNRALRLVGPTLVCPLSFCFYNCASIASGLIYYREIDALSPLQAWMLALGTAVLLGGVWVVSVKPCAKKGADEAREAALWADEPLEMETEGDSCSSDDEPGAPPRSLPPSLPASHASTDLSSLRYNPTK